MRLRTLPVSVSGVLAGTAVACAFGCFRWLPALICLLFAIGAQILSNFANEYFDFKNGIDDKGRAGFRRGLTEGDLTPEAMKKAMTWLGIGVAAVGSTLVIWGGWQMIVVGICIFIGALAYSAGPYPLSHHALGDVAVIIFYGFVPVILTAWLQDWAAGPGVCAREIGPAGEHFKMVAFLYGFSVGLMGMNVLIVNNYRDEESDRAKGKQTTVVKYGRYAMALVYMAAWLVADYFLFMVAMPATGILQVLLSFLIFVPLQLALWNKMLHSEGAQLNKVLASTAKLMFAETLWISVWLIAC